MNRFVFLIVLIELKQSLAHIVPCHDIIFDEWFNSDVGLGQKKKRCDNAIRKNVCKKQKRGCPQSVQHICQSKAIYYFDLFQMKTWPLTFVTITLYSPTAHSRRAFPLRKTEVDLLNPCGSNRYLAAFVANESVIFLGWFLFIFSALPSCLLFLLHCTYECSRQTQAELFLSIMAF